MAGSDAAESPRGSARRSARAQGRGRAVRVLARAAAGQPRTPSPPAPPHTPPGILAMLGEVSTALLPTATALQHGEVRELLEFSPDHRVRWRERPVSLGISPPVAEGVDCGLAVARHPAVRAIGTIALRATVVGGRIVQSSARCSITRSASDKRQGWFHYLSRVGVLEVMTRVTHETPARLAEGFLGDRPSSATLDLTSPTDRLLGRIGLRRLDNEAPLRAGTLRLRWAARVGDLPRAQVALRVHDDLTRTALIVVPTESELDGVQRFCEDLAAHDWLLTVAADAVERADLAGPGTAESVDILAPVLEHLAHLWVPGAHTPAALRDLWAQLAEEPDLAAQWLRTVGHMRNRLLVSTWKAMHENAG